MFESFGGVLENSRGFFGILENMPGRMEKSIPIAKFHFEINFDFNYENRREFSRHSPVGFLGFFVRVLGCVEES